VQRPERGGGFLAVEVRESGVGDRDNKAAIRGAGDPVPRDNRGAAGGAEVEVL
jgi:hypothetical protein